MARARRRKDFGPDAIQPVRGGVATQRAHDLSPRAGGSLPPTEPREDLAGEVTAPSALPSLYAGWMADALPGAIPSEPHATCDDCAMTPAPGAVKTENDTLYYGTGTKCCTLVPNIPNYLAGRILSDTDPHPAAVEGRRTVLERIRSRGAVTPLGLGRTLAFSLHYRHHPERFGQSEALRCPHYVEDGGLCGVWKHRESTCAAWFCKYDRGVVGVRFWSALRELLAAVEHALAYWSLRQVGLDHEPIRRLYAAGAASLARKPGSFAGHLLDGALETQPLRLHPLGARGAEAHSELWGAWAGREVELFVASAKHVDPLRWSEVTAIIGPPLAPLIARAVEQYRALRTFAIPERLSSRNSELGLVQIGRGQTRADSYRAQDPHRLPTELLELLPEFDGRTAEEALAIIEARSGRKLDPLLIRKLIDFGLLVGGGAC